MNSIKVKIKKSVKLEILLSDIQTVLENKESLIKPNCSVLALCNLGIKITIKYIKDSIAELSIITTSDSKNHFLKYKKDLLCFFLNLINERGFEIKDLISIDLFVVDKTKPTTTTWRDIKKSREFKYNRA